MVCSIFLLSCKPIFVEMFRFYIGRQFVGNEERDILFVHCNGAEHNYHCILITLKICLNDPAVKLHEVQMVFNNEYMVVELV